MIELPWPPKILNPNHKTHWGNKSKAAKKYRHDCAILTLMARIPVILDGDFKLSITFYPPDKRHRDDDNIIAAFKSGRDGVADALGVNDKRFKPDYLFGLPVKHGKVVIEL